MFQIKNMKEFPVSNLQCVKKMEYRFTLRVFVVAGGCWQVRYTLAMLSLVGIALMYAMRVVLSIAIVAMVGSHSHHGNNSHDTSNVCPGGEELIVDYVNDTSEHSQQESVSQTHIL